MNLVLPLPRRAVPRRRAPRPLAAPAESPRVRDVVSPVPLTSRLARPRAAAVAHYEAVAPVVGRLRAVAWLPAALLAACAVALAYLLQTSGIATTSYDIQRLQAERSEWHLRNEQIRLEIAKRRSLAWVEAEAVGRLGMVPAEGVTYLTVQAERRPERPSR